MRPTQYDRLSQQQLDFLFNFLSPYSPTGTHCWVRPVDLSDVSHVTLLTYLRSDNHLAHFRSHGRPITFHFGSRDFRISPPNIVEILLAILTFCSLKHSSFRRHSNTHYFYQPAYPARHGSLVRRTSTPNFWMVLLRTCILKSSSMFPYS